MEGQPYSLAFRNNYPKFNGLIWGYHWLQVGLYEPLMTGRNLEERQAGVSAAVARFRQMLENAPEHMPRMMPMTAAVAPTFARKYPEAAIIFDNLHSMHDVVSDILANPKVPHDRKRAEILRAAAAYRDRTSYVITPAEWMEMAQMMGLENMGGPAVGILPGWPTPTIARGQPASEAMKNMAGKSGASASMPGMKMDSSSAGAAGMAGMDHSKMPGMKPADSTSKAAMNHGDMNMAVDSAAKGAGMNMGMKMDQSSMMQMHMRMMQDPVIRERVMRDTTMRRLMNGMMQSMPANHEMNMGEMTPAAVHHAAPSSSPKVKSRTTTSTKTKTTSAMTKSSATGKAKSPPKTTSAAKKKPAAKPAPKPMPPMDHSKMKMPGMEMPPAKKN